MRKLLLLLFPLILSSCWLQEPLPKGRIDFMTIYTQKTEQGNITAKIMAEAMWGTNGPVEVSFDSAEVWLEEVNVSSKKLVAVTEKKEFVLENLEKNKLYNVYAKGIKKGVKTDFSKPSRFSTYEFEKISPLTDLPSNVTVFANNSSRYVAYYYNMQLVLLDKLSGVEIKRSRIGENFRLIGLFENQAIFEGYRNNNRVFFSFDITKEELSEKKIPSQSRVWSYAFSNDASKIAYKDYSRSGLWIYDFTKEQETNHTEVKFFHDITFGYDDNTLLISRNGDNLGEIELASYDITLQKFSSILVKSDARNPKFSPDGKYLMFNGSFSRLDDIWIYQIGTAKEWNLSSSSVIGWSNNNTVLAFRSFETKPKISAFTLKED